MGGGLALGGPGENPRSVTPKRETQNPAIWGSMSDSGSSSVRNSLNLTRQSPSFKKHSKELHLLDFLFFLETNLQSRNLRPCRNQENTIFRSELVTLYFGVVCRSLHLHINNYVTIYLCKSLGFSYFTSLESHHNLKVGGPLYHPFYRPDKLYHHNST